MRQAKVQSQDKRKRNNNEHADEEGPPLELPRATRMVNALGELHVRLLGVLDDVLGLLFGGLHGRLLDDDGLGEILEQLVELLQRLLDLHDVIVAGADGTEDGGCGAGAVRFQLGGVSAIRGRRCRVLTAVWKTPSSPQFAVAASCTSSSLASGFTMRYWRAICSWYRFR